MAFDKLGADRLADEVEKLIVDGKLDGRSPAADALLDYREPSDRSELLKRIARERVISRSAEIDREVEEMERLKAIEAAAREVVAHLGPGGYIPNAGKPKTDALLKALGIAV